jgi:hypothetical protein
MASGGSGMPPSCPRGGCATFRLDARVGRLGRARDAQLRARLLDALGGGEEIAIRGERLVDEPIEDRIAEDRPPALRRRYARLRDTKFFRQVDGGTHVIGAEGAR